MFARCSDRVANHVAESGTVSWVTSWLQQWKFALSVATLPDPWVSHRGVRLGWSNLINWRRFADTKV